MCDPVTASIALTVAGTAAQAAGANRAKKAMEGAQAAERIRQKGFQDESAAVQAGSEARMSKGNQDKEQAAAEAGRKADSAAAVEAAQAPVIATGNNLAGDQTANAVIAGEVAKQSGRNLGYAGQQGDAKAALLGFNDLQLGNALANARAMEKQRTLGNFMQGSSGVLGLEMDAASHKGDGLKTLGSLLSTAGGIAGMGAGAGWWGAKDAAPQIISQSATASGVQPALMAKPLASISGLNPNAFTLGNLANPLLSGTAQPAMFPSFKLGK